MVQRAKKVVSDSLGLMYFAYGLVNSVFNLPNGQVMFFEEFEWQKNCEINSANQMFLGLVEVTSGLVNASFSLPKWQAVQMIFFAPCGCCIKKCWRQYYALLTLTINPWHMTTTLNSHTDINTLKSLLSQEKDRLLNLSHKTQPVNGLCSQF